LTVFISFKLSENTIKVNLNNSKIRSSNLDIPIGGQLFDHSNTPLVNDSIGLTIRGYGLHEENGIVIFLDALRMKGIWKSFKPIEVIKMWNNVVGFFKDSLDQSRLSVIPCFRTLSDTIIITIASQPSHFESIISKAFYLLLEPFIQSLKIRMLLRGTISCGTYYLSQRLIIGPALDDAAYHHDKLDWIGISLSPTQCSSLNNITSPGVVYYNDIPQKDSHYGGFVLNSPKFDSNGKCYSILEEEGANVHRPDIKVKYDNTFKFYDNVKTTN
jgi:hypothetical protein